MPSSEPEIPVTFQTLSGTPRWLGSLELGQCLFGLAGCMTITPDIPYVRQSADLQECGY